MATPVSGTQINLAWTDTSNNPSIAETAFRVERKGGASGAYSEIATLGANVTQYNNTGLTIGTTYFYRVRATNTSGNSPYSNEVSAATLAPPIAPARLNATAVTGTRIDLAWLDMSGNETGFKVERKAGAGGTYSQIATVGTNVAQFSDTGVSSGITYFYRVRATNAVGDSSYSNEANATTPLPSAQQQLYFVHVDHLNTPRLVANSQGQVVWRWDQQEPFGVTVPDQNPSGLGTFEFPMRLPGQYFDKETNLHYNYFRDYDPMIGRYIESDPIGLDGGLNTYEYAASHPLLTIDLLGLQSDLSLGFGSGQAATFFTMTAFAAAQRGYTVH